MTIFPVEQELQRLRDRVAALETENAELKANQKPVEADDWYDSGCTIDDGWDESAAHWSEDDWYSSSC